MPQVDYTREEWKQLKPRWDLVRDCVSGSKAIKDKGKKYLPIPNEDDISDENKTRYNQYLLRAVYYNVTGRTLAGMSGQVFAREPVVVIPPQLEVLQRDVDGSGVSLDQQARKALSHILAYGRAGLLVDYPTREAPVSIAEQEAGKVRPTVTIFDPWDVINWRITTVNGRKLLTLVVLSEKEVSDDDGFEQQWNNYYRVLRLVDGVYHSQLWFKEDGKTDFTMKEGTDVIPLDGDGKPWTEIPFQFVGSVNNDENPDLPPLYDMAELNIAHYRNSADHEESCFMVGQPTPVLSGLTKDWVEDVMENKIFLGSRAAIMLPVGGKGELMQAEANTMPREAMQDKERQMVALGAKLVEQKTVQRTAAEAGMEEASTTSLLATCANNVSQAYTQCLAWAAKFFGIDGKNTEGKEISYTLNTEFDIAKLGAPELTALIAAWQANAIAKEEMRDALRRAGYAYLSDEEFKDAIEAEGLNLGVPVGGPASAAADALKAQADANAAKLKAGSANAN